MRNRQRKTANTTKKKSENNNNHNQKNDDNENDNNNNASFSLFLNKYIEYKRQKRILFDQIFASSFLPSYSMNEDSNHKTQF